MATLVLHHFHYTMTSTLDSRLSSQIFCLLKPQFSTYLCSIDFTDCLSSMRLVNLDRFHCRRQTTCFSQFCNFGLVLGSIWYLTTNISVTLETSSRLFVDQVSSPSANFLGRCNQTAHRLRSYWSLSSTVQDVRDTWNRSATLLGMKTRHLWVMPTASVFLCFIHLVHRRLWILAYPLISWHTI